MGVGNGVVGEGLEGGCGGVDLGAGRQREDPPANKSDTKSFKKFPTPHHGSVFCHRIIDAVTR